jgi:hypothetical protein
MMRRRVSKGLSRRDVARRSVAWLCGVYALPSWAQVPATGPGAKDLFFGDDKPVVMEERSVRPRMGSGSGTGSVTGSNAAPATPRKVSSPAPTSPGLRVWLAAADDPAGTKRLSPQQTFKTGDRFRLWMESNRNGYIYLLNVGTSGTTRVMFPRAGQDNRISARKAMALSSALVFGEPAGTEQLVAVLSAEPVEDAAVQLKDGSMMKVGLKPGAATPARKDSGTTNAASASLDLALADLKGSKDLKFEDDGSELVAVSQRSNEGTGAFAPVVINLRLTHRP